MPQRKWIIFAVMASMYVLAYFYRVSAAVLAGDLVADLHLSAAELGKVSAALFYAFALVQIPLGPVLDRFGARWPVFLLGLVTALGALWISLATDYAGALAGRAMIGAGTACVLMGSLKLYTVWFAPDRFATLSGMQVALGNCGNLLATAPLAWLAATLGWRSTFTGLALLTAAMALVALAVVRNAPGPVKVSVVRRPSLVQGWKTLAREPSFWMLCPPAFFWYGGYMAVQGLWGGPYLQKVLGCDNRQAAGLLFYVALGFILGCPLAGRLSDRVLRSRKKVLAAGMGLLAVLLGMLTGPLEQLPEILRPVFFLLFGVCVSTGPILYAQVKELFAGELAATAMTALNFFVLMGAALMQQAMGELLARRGPELAASFRLAYALPSAGLALSLVCYLFCRDTHPR